jgi:hypothetical protein
MQHASGHRKSVYFSPPQKITPISQGPTSDCLKPPFWYQKVYSKTFLAPDSGNIFCENNNLSGSDPDNPDNKNHL